MTDKVKGSYSEVGNWNEVITKSGFTVASVAAAIAAPTTTLAIQSLYRLLNTPAKSETQFSAVVAIANGKSTSADTEQWAERLGGLFSDTANSFAAALQELTPDISGLRSLTHRQVKDENAFLAPSSLAKTKELTKDKASFLS